jgi:Holliday junction resolvase RusA-like endonuclease
MDGGAGVSRSWTITIPLERPPLTMNEWRNTHWAEKHRVRKDVHLFVAAFAPKSGLPKLGRCAIEIVWHPKRGGRRDNDSLAAFGKDAIDALVRLGYLVDDASRYVTGTRYRIGAPDKAKPRIDILITEERI